MPPRASVRSLLLDADVLIDYGDGGWHVVELLSRHRGGVCVARYVLQEARSVSVEECERCGVEILDPTTDQLLEAGRRGGPLSFTDWLGLILARDEEMTCVTNDRRLRKECGTLGVRVSWGLELMLDLVGRGALAGDEALTVARRMQGANPHHLTEVVIERFARRVRAISG